MRYFIISDVHGFYDEMIKSLTAAGYDKDDDNHILVVLGDLMDRGPKSMDCLKFVLGVKNKILIKGNHESLLQEVFESKIYRQYDYSNGTVLTINEILDSMKYDSTKVKTMEQYIELAATNELVNEYLDSLIYYYETKTAIFVHGWIPCYLLKGKEYEYYPLEENWRNASNKNWENAMWINGMDAWNKGIRDDKTIFCGHFHTSWGHSKLHKNGVEFPNKYSTNPEHHKAIFNPFIDNGIVAIDACTVYTHKVNCYVLKEE